MKQLLLLLTFSVIAIPVFGQISDRELSKKHDFHNDSLATLSKYYKSIPKTPQAFNYKLNDTGFIDGLGINLFFDENPSLMYEGDFVDVQGSFLTWCGLQSEGTLKCTGSNVLSPIDTLEIDNTSHFALTGRQLVTVSESGDITMYTEDDLLAIYNTQVPSIQGSKTIKDIQMNYHSVIVLYEDGTVSVVGNYTVPSSLSSVDKISAKWMGALVLYNNGEIEAFGYNNGGSLSIPPSGRYIDIALGREHGVALTTDSTVVCWTESDRGQCNIPDDIPPLSSISVGEDHTLALGNDGQLYSWGGENETVNKTNELWINPIDYDAAWSGNMVVTKEYIGGVELISPENNSSNHPSNLDLEWKLEDGTGTFRYEVSTDSTFDQINITGLISVASNQNSVVESLSGLSNQTKYYWRVNESNGKWSKTWNFSTKAAEGTDFYIDDDGIVRCEGMSPGDTQTIFGETYTVVDRSELISLIRSGEDVTRVCTSLIKDLSYLFIDLGEFTLSNFNQNISSWDVSNVTNMEGTFFRAVDFNQDISNWDVSSVTNMKNMFRIARAFDADISNWDVSGVTNMYGMFQDKGKESSFSFDITEWDVSSVTNMAWMFEYSTFNQDISRWDISNVTTMSNMFNNADEFTHDLSSWDVSNVKDMSGMFRNNSGSIFFVGEWDVSSVTNMSNMFEAITAPLDSDISLWDVSSVTNMNRMFYGTDFNQNLSQWCVPNVTNEPDGFGNNGVNPLWGTCPNTPSIPTKTSPSDNSSDVSLNIEFEWSSDDLTTHTQLQIFEGVDPIILDTTIPDNTFSNTEPFKSNTTYNWRIRGINQSDSLRGEPKMSDWSSVTSFTTLLLPPESITLSSPSDESTGVTLTPTLSWSEDTNSESYTLQVSTDGFESFVVNESVSETSFTTSGLGYNTEYSWRVRGTNSSGDGDWSEVWKFTTQYRQLSSSTPLNPQDGQDNVGTLTDFRWSEVDSVESYQLQVTTDSTFTTQMFQSEEIDTTTFTLTDPIRENTQYFWRVRSLGQVEQQHSDWSEVMSFTTGVRTSVEEVVPTDYSLDQNFPNPFNPTTTITYSLPQSGIVTLNVYDITGKFVTTLVDGVKGVGTHTVQFEGSSLSSGMYVYTLQTDGFRQTRQMMLVK